jgi:hypothetical protein
MEDDWPFADPVNVAVLTLRQIVQEGWPILQVSHDDDGTWQFLGWETPCETDVLVVSLANIVRMDSTVKQLADLPLGWRAWRQRAEEEWRRAPKLSEGA